MKTNNMGRTCVMRDIKHRPANIVSAVIIGVNGDNRVTRLRLQTGEHAGETRALGQFEVLEYCRHEEAAGILAGVWAD